MAVYDGFFDFDAQVLEATGKYDREYSSKDFTGYYGAFIGSGVCVYNNPDSMKVSIEGSTAWIARGYLFIDGYWLANVPGPEEDPSAFRGYQVILPPTGEYAVVARLDLARRLIELTYTEKADSYPNCLVLGYANPGEGTVTDTRRDISICGEIDALGSLSAKVQYAVNYIDNEIEDRLNQAQEQLKAQEERLNAEIARVSAQVDKLTPPAVGTVKFTASQNVGPEWLRCDGSFISEADYPELVAALGKLIPSNDQLQLLSEGEIGPQISNGVLYEGRMWVYSYSTKMLYGVDLAGGGTKEISLTSTDSRFKGFVTPSTQHPLALSIVPSLTGGSTKIFLAQVLANNDDVSESDSDKWPSMMLLFGGNFSPSESSISLAIPFQTATNPKIDDTNFWMWEFEASTCVPYVISSVESGEEWYFCATKGVDMGQAIYFAKWKSGSNSALAISKGSQNTMNPKWPDSQRVAFSTKSRKEAVSMPGTMSNNRYYVSVLSQPTGMFSRDSFESIGFNVGSATQTPNALNLVGTTKMLLTPSKEAAYVVFLNEKKIQYVQFNVKLPGMARIFVDGGAYLWGKDIYMLFVGTGILFSRTLESGSFGYLDTTSILGTITQWGYLDYSQDEGELYILGQDTTNTVKLAKIVLNTLYDYANDGAWLPNIASDGVPAYIKAKEATESEAV